MDQSKNLVTNGLHKQYLFETYMYVELVASMCANKIRRKTNV